MPSCGYSQSILIRQPHRHDSTTDGRFSSVPFVSPGQNRSEDLRAQNSLTRCSTSCARRLKAKSGDTLKYPWMDVPWIAENLLLTVALCVVLSFFFVSIDRAASDASTSHERASFCQSH